MKKTLLAFIALITILCLGCKKNSSTPGGGSADGVKYIILTTKDANGAGVLCLNADNTTRWQRTGLGKFIDKALYCSEGIIYVPYADYNQATGETHGNLHAIDAATGKDIWVITHSTEVFFNLYQHNGALYAYIQTVAGYYLGALDAKTGKALWRVPVNSSYISDFTVDENVLYFNEATNNQGSLTAFNLTSKLTLWKVPGGMFNPSPKGILIKGGHIYAPKQDPSAAIAIEKATGKVTWVADGWPFSNISYGSSALYYFNINRQLCAINFSDGSAAWTAPVIREFNSLSVQGQRLYVTGYSLNAAIKPAVYCANAQDGTIVWQKEVSDILSYPVAAGGALYAYNETSKAIVIFSTGNGNVVGNIPLSVSSDGYCEIITNDDTLVTPDE